MSKKKEYVREDTIEKYLVKQVEALGGRCYKWTSPGNPGVPDRIVILPGIAPWFVETKAPKGRPRPTQKVQVKRLYELGQNACFVYSKEDVDFILKKMNHK